MFEAMIADAARRHGLDPELFRRQIMVESGGNANAVNRRSGATGLGQLMPGTAAGLGVTDARDPQQNLNASATYMQQMLAKFGSYPQALAAYNWGPGNLGKAGGNVAVAPAETQGYLRKILGGGPVPIPQPDAMPVPPIPPAAPPVALAAAPAPAPAQPAPAPSQMSNDQAMQQRVAAGQMADRGTLSSLLLGFQQAASGQPAAPQPAKPSLFGLG